MQALCVFSEYGALGFSAGAGIPGRPSTKLLKSASNLGLPPRSVIPNRRVSKAVFMARRMRPLSRLSTR